MKHLHNRVAGAIFGFALMFGIGVSSGLTGHAQYRNDRDAQDRRERDDRDDRHRGRNADGYGNYGGSFQLRQTALNAGYNEGLKAGREDRQNGRYTDYRSQSTYQKADKDYSPRLGDRELYRRYFREAFENGYASEGDVRDGRDRADRADRDRDRDRNQNGDQTRRGRNWDRYGSYGGSFQLRQTALNAGYNDGIKAGRNDRNRRNRADYRDQSAYQKATRDYSSRLGDRELYRRYYREGYENGYNDGLNSY